MKYLQPLTRYSSTVLPLLVLLATCYPARAADNPYDGPNDGNWNVSANWGFVPPDVEFNEVGVVNNGNTVVLNEHTKTEESPGSGLFDVDIAGLRLGSAASTTGGLRITSGGVMNAVPHTGTFTPPESGAIAIGGAGQGNLTILGNGRLTGTSLTLGGTAGSSITLSDTATLAIAAIGATTNGNVSLQRTTMLNGPGVTFTAGGNLSLTGTSILVPNITATGSPKIVTQGTATVAGTLKPTFTGVTPTAGNKWTILDAPSTINGTFGTIDASMAPALPAGTTYSVFAETVGSRRLLQLAVEEILVLQVNRITGAATIANLGTQPKSLDGYSILSEHGSLRAAEWDSLEGRVPGWVEAGPTVEALSELYPNLPAPGFTTIPAGGSLTLGTPYEVTVPALGVDPDDLTFEYNSPTRGTVRGVVQYTGTKILNNFVLTIDPGTGQAQIKLDSPIATEIDGYAIYSDSGSLTPATWNSLQDQAASIPAAAGWEQAPPAPGATAVGELKADGSLEFQNSTGFQLGQLFKTVGGTQDLRFEVLMPGQSVPFLGTVVYGPITPVGPPSAGLPGDFNGDGAVNAADYVVWRKTNGTPAGYNEWRTNFGRTSGSGSGVGSSAVPEPGTAALLILSALAFVGRRCVRK
jgi:hypothetical protein